MRYFRNCSRWLFEDKKLNNSSNIIFSSRRLFPVVASWGKTSGWILKDKHNKCYDLNRSSKRRKCVPAANVTLIFRFSTNFSGSRLLCFALIFGKAQCQSATDCLWFKKGILSHACAFSEFGSVVYKEALCWIFVIKINNTCILKNN
jgi:hypothetical protein